MAKITIDDLPFFKKFSNAQIELTKAVFSLCEFDPEIAKKILKKSIEEIDELVKNNQDFTDISSIYWNSVKKHYNGRT